MLVTILASVLTVALFTAIVVAVDVTGGSLSGLRRARLRSELLRACWVERRAKKRKEESDAQQCSARPGRRGPPDQSSSRPPGRARSRRWWSPGEGHSQPDCSRLAGASAFVGSQW